MDYSYSYQNLVRDLSNTLVVVKQKSPTLIGLIGNGPDATQKKHEWLNDVVVPQESAVNNGAGYLSTDVSIVVDNAKAFLVDSIVAADGSDEVMLVTAIDTATNTLTVTRGYGSTTAEALVDNQLIRMISRPRAEGTQRGDDAGRQPGTDWNATQIFDRTAKLTKSAQSILQYGIDDALDYQVRHQLLMLLQDMNKTAIYGRRIEWAEGVVGAAGGILQFLRAGQNVVDAAGGANSTTLLNNLIEKLVLASGGLPVTLLCNTNQARKFAAFNSTTSNYTVRQESTVAGNVVYQYQGDLPMQGMVQNIVIDPHFPKDAIAMLHLDHLKLVALKGRQFKDEDATLPGEDAWARRILGEYTFEFRNLKETCGILTNLA